MSNNIKKISMEEIAKKYENITVLSKTYDFPRKVLFKELENFYINQRKQAGLFEITEEEKEEIYKLFRSGTPLPILARKYGTTPRLLASEITKMETRKITNEEKEKIYELFKTGVPMSSLTKMYHITYQTISRIINRGQNNDKKTDKTKIPMDEIEQAYIDKTMSKLAKKYKVSLSGLYYKLKKTYGNEYVNTLKEKRKKGATDEIIKLYEEYGYSALKISKVNPDFSVSKVRDTLQRHYAKKNKKVPRLVKKEVFLQLLKSGKSIKEILSETEKVDFLVPKIYIDEYLDSNNEINVEDIKLIVNRELKKLSREDKKPNYIEPFEFANILKSKGYDTKYQAVALLYKLIKYNDLPLDKIVKDVKNDDIRTALYILAYKNMTFEEYKEGIENNEIAKAILLEEKQQKEQQGKNTSPDEELNIPSLWEL